MGFGEEDGEEFDQGRGNDWRPRPTPPKRKIMNSGPGPIFFPPGTIPDILPRILGNYIYI